MNLLVRIDRAGAKNIGAAHCQNETNSALCSAILDTARTKVGNDGSGVLIRLEAP
jgi:hypothetical protein